MYFKAVCLYHMSPTIVFTDVKKRVLATKQTNLMKQTSYLNFVKPFFSKSSSA